MANHTGPNPQEGVLDKETLKSFFGYSGPDDALVHTPGTERILENCTFCATVLADNSSARANDSHRVPPPHRRLRLRGRSDRRPDLRLH
jgi:hypothetical protein